MAFVAPVWTRLANRMWGWLEDRLFQGRLDRRPSVMALEALIGEVWPVVEGAKAEKAKRSWKLPQVCDKGLSQAENIDTAHELLFIQIGQLIL